MNEKLSDNELIEELDSAFGCKLAAAWEYPSRKPVIEQAYEQIKSLIESQAQPRVSREFVNERARGLCLMVISAQYISFDDAKYGLLEMLKEAGVEVENTE